jgi:hypothetical protein
MLRPKLSKPPPSQEEQAEKVRKMQVAAAQLYNPYEAKKRPAKSGKRTKHSITQNGMSKLHAALVCTCLNMLI